MTYRDFAKEASLLMEVNNDGGHVNIVSLVGLVVDGVKKKDPRYILVEYAEPGELLWYLVNVQNNRHQAGFPPGLGRQLTEVAIDIVRGMVELERRRITHRDLACRNIVLCSPDGQAGRLVAKISDFGLARDVYVTTQYMRHPLWMAIESLIEGVYSCKSDMWGFGVVLWEMATLGAQPRLVEPSSDTGTKLARSTHDLKNFAQVGRGTEEGRPNISRSSREGRPRNTAETREMYVRISVDSRPHKGELRASYARAGNELCDVKNRRRLVADVKNTIRVSASFGRLQKIAGDPENSRDARRNIGRGTPYPEVYGYETLVTRLRRGYRLQKPNGCSDELYEVMKLCWQDDPDVRPTPDVMEDRLEQLMEQDRQCRLADGGGKAEGDEVDLKFGRRYDGDGRFLRFKEVIDRSSSFVPSLSQGFREAPAAHCICKHCSRLEDELQWRRPDTCEICNIWNSSPRPGRVLETFSEQKVPMLRVCEKLREADEKGRRYGLARAETGYLRALAGGSGDALKTLGDVNVEKGRLGKDVGKFNTALALYIAAMVRCYHEEQADGIEHRYHYTERLLQGVSSQGKKQPTEDKETTTPAKVAAKFQALDKRRATGGNTDSLLVSGYAKLMVEAIVKDDSVLETEAIKSLGDVYLKRGTETGDTRNLTRATALYNRALARCHNVHGTVVIVHRLLHTAKIRQYITNTRDKTTKLDQSTVTPPKRGTFCGRVQDAVRDFPRESAGRPPGECDTFCGRVRYVQRESANIARRLPGERRGLACPTVFEDWTGSGCNIKGAGGFC
ncbi:hypothetical protein Bbelb_117400 [Branchiostoma belcheri]|nr:hypothetical protein Bbelb_117400 [Branchiostoma belcheri]